MLQSKFERVMIIDDNLIDKYIIKHLIRKTSFSNIILEYCTAEEALQYLKDNQNELLMLPQIIFVDLYMPGMSGFDFMKAYDKLSYILKNTCKVFIVSAIDIYDSDIQKLDDRNIISFLNKPITKTHLTVIERLIY